MLVSDIHHFSTLDVYNGYKRALKRTGVSHVNFEYHDFSVDFSKERSCDIMLSNIHKSTNGITHVLFVSGMAIPEWVLSSCGNKKVGIIALDDPHNTMNLLEKTKYCDWYFTNERKVANEELGRFYVPTASESIVPSFNHITDEYKNDVVFIGTIYPDRLPILEKAVSWCETHGKKIRIIGPGSGLGTVPELGDSHKFIITDNITTKKYYVGSKITLNIDRNIEWNTQYDIGNPDLFPIEGEAYSCNPRFYEIALCKSTQLYINPREEAFDLFGEDFYYGTNDDIEAKLEEIFSTEETVLQEKKDRCYKKVVESHLYENRLERILNVINQGEQNG